MCIRTTFGEGKSILRKRGRIALGIGYNKNGICRYREYKTKKCQ